MVLFEYDEQASAAWHMDVVHEVPEDKPVPVARRVESLRRLNAIEDPLGRRLVALAGPALLAGVASRRPVVVLVALSGLSGAVEALQALVPGLGRSCDTTDWSSNTIGAGTGAGPAAAALVLARADRGHAEEGATSEPSAHGGSTPSP